MYISKKKKRSKVAKGFESCRFLLDIFSFILAYLLDNIFNDNISLINVWGVFKFLTFKYAGCIQHFAAVPLCTPLWSPFRGEIGGIKRSNGLMLLINFEIHVRVLLVAPAFSLTASYFQTTHARSSSLHITILP